MLLSITAQHVLQYNVESAECLVTVGEAVGETQSEAGSTSKALCP